MPEIGMIKFQMGGDPTHTMGRTPGGDCTPKALSAFVDALMERLSWFGSPEGRRSLNSKGTNEMGVAYGVIQSTLEFCADAGISPIDIVENALMGFEACSGGNDIREARLALAVVLDRCDREKAQAADVAPDAAQA